ncbi:MAG: hypothetical protein JSS50_05515 [Proteobacteria bacterium]|nr:hypothetical protein [Pseudomonadota bacterium]
MENKLSIARNLDEFYKNPNVGSMRDGANTVEFKQASIGLVSNGEVLNGKYRINFSKPIQEKNSEFADAYIVEDATGDVADLYALVLKTDYPARVPEIISAKARKDLPCVTPLECVFIKPPSAMQQRLALILPQTKWLTLREFINTPQSKKVNRQDIFASIVEAVDFLHKASIVHGSLNPDAIYVDDDLNIILAECFSQMPGFKQLPLYTTIGNLQCHAYGRGCSTPATDYYALGILLFFIITKNDLQDKSADFIMKGIISSGIYAFLTENFSVPGEYVELIQGLTHSNPSKRFEYNEVMRYLSKDNIAKTTNIEHSYLETGLVFNDIEINSLEALAVVMFKNWDQAKEFLKRDDLVKWLSHGGKQQNLADSLSELKQRIKSKTVMSKLFSPEDELLIKSLILIDPHGPIRLQGTAFYKESVGNLLLYGLNNNIVDLTQVVANCVFADLFSFYDEPVMRHVMTMGDKYHQSNELLRNASSNFRKSGFYFGIERLIYDLNPALPAIHTRLKSACCMSLEDLLMEIESAKEVDRVDMLSSKGLLSFISSKLQLDSEYTGKSSIKESVYVLPILCCKELQTANAYAMAQKHIERSRFPAIAETLYNFLRGVVEEFIHGKENKKAILAALQDATEKADISALFMALAKSELLGRDADGYASALRKVQKISDSINDLRGRQAIELRAMAEGKRLAVYVSYFIACFILVSVMLRVM